MMLYKNVDICNLPSIMQKGVLSMDECGNNNWDTGKRVQNDTSVVYLFSPIGEKNSFPNYGDALLEVECSAAENAMAVMDSTEVNFFRGVSEDCEMIDLKDIEYIF